MTTTRDDEKEGAYSLLPLLPPFLRVLSVGTGVTSSAKRIRDTIISSMPSKGDTTMKQQSTLGPAVREGGVTRYVFFICIYAAGRQNLPMRPIFMPERASALRADWAPGPGVLVLLPPVARSLMCKAVMPSSWKRKWKIHKNPGCRHPNTK